jgi:hypothetical protein
MKFWLRRCALVLSFAAVSCLALSREQGRSASPSTVALPSEEQAPPAPPDARLPNGKLQRDEILKAEHEQNLKDAAQLAELAEQLKSDLEKNGRFVYSISTFKKTDEIEKLVKKIRSRLRRS